MRAVPERYEFSLRRLIHYIQQQAVHSDSIHFQSAPARYMCGVWIALEPVDVENGALFYYPGSHRLPLFNMDDIGTNLDCDAIQARSTVYTNYIVRYAEQCGIKRETLTLSRGHGLIWAANRAARRFPNYRIWKDSA